MALSQMALSWPWALPFIGLLLSIAVGPLAAPKLWHAHIGKIAFLWSVVTLAPLAAIYGAPTALTALTRALLGEYVSFIIMLTALYVVAGGILVTGRLNGGPLVNTAILALGTALASVAGTTGAAMILIRPLLRANAARLNNVHVVVFFIFLAGNIGGALSPLGDPPLFVGFLHGVDFFWPATHLWRPTALTAVLVLAAFFTIDVWYYRQDRLVSVVGEKLAPDPIRIRGLVNLVLVALIVAASELSALWKPAISLTISGTAVQLQDIARNAALAVITLASLLLTPDEHRERNAFTWAPIVEVAFLFAGIFICVVPVMTMLEAGRVGAFSGVLALTADAAGEARNAVYFWLTGALAAVLNNAPAYRVLFGLAGGDAGKAMADLAPTLTAISMAAVYMGALTYIGNAPNFMIYAIATERGVKMPSFLRYIAWSAGVLLPVFALVTYVFLLG
jgi:Na+/H+ antiporter NhaD/arsenite permease-like protein